MYAAKDRLPSLLFFFILSCSLFFVDSLSHQFTWRFERNNKKRDFFPRKRIIVDRLQQTFFYYVFLFCFFSCKCFPMNLGNCFLHQFPASHVSFFFFISISELAHAFRLRLFLFLVFSFSLRFYCYCFSLASLMNNNEYYVISNALLLLWLLWLKSLNTHSRTHTICRKIRREMSGNNVDGNDNEEIVHFSIAVCVGAGIK